MKALRNCVLTATAAALLSGCSGMYTKDGTPNDPWEGFNRGVFTFNDTLDHYALRPVAQGYQSVTPEPVRDSVSHFFSNLGDVRNTFNGVLQGNPVIAGTSLSRFVINTTLGIGGLLDPATQLGLGQRKEDMGKTLAAWGFKSGPFLMLPLLGPSTLRDTAGLPVDWYTSVTSHIDNNYARWGLRFVDVVQLRASLLDQEKLMKGDRYTFIRDAWMQHRQFEIDGGKVTQDPFASGDIDLDAPDSQEPAGKNAAPNATAPTNGANGAAVESAPSAK